MLQCRHPQLQCAVMESHRSSRECVLKSMGGLHRRRPGLGLQLGGVSCSAGWKVNELRCSQKLKICQNVTFYTSLRKHISILILKSMEWMHYTCHFCIHRFVLLLNWQIRLVLGQSQIIYEAISCLVNYRRECLVGKACLQLVGSPPISLNPFGNLSLNHLPEPEQFLKAGILLHWNGRNFKYDPLPL